MSSPARNSDQGNHEPELSRQVAEFLLRWRELRAQGQDVSAEQLCGDRREFLEPLQRGLRALEAMEAFLDLDDREAVQQAGAPGEDAATLSPRPERGPSAAATAGPVVPGYQILAELGRGGMGVVYRARQAKLNRLVALKMILAGAHAGDDDRRRFLTEAEAVARLQHPNIVQIHELGEADGHPFLALELCPGGSLADKLAGTPLPPQEAARVAEQLARAVHHAHGKGIVHRDLKPANVLLAEDGTPKVTDFGLAKRVEVGSGQTASGAILGTPSYMAPEQAAGSSKRVGPAADVYALGAILYECLTGRPPFKAAALAETLLQVLSEEPASVRQLQPGVPADLETICHRCLQKEAPNRYGSAAELADDLRRFQKEEPILARPVGRVEKAARWARRNPVVAGSLAAVLLVLVVGIVVSAYFAVDAARQAEQARARGADLETANAGLTQTRDELETTLARSLLRPLGFRSGPLTDPEIEALWELAENRGERLGLRFVDEALRSPMATRQLKARAEPALHAAVRLDPDRRAQVERLLVERLQDPRLSDEQRTELALVAVALGDLTPTASADVARALSHAMAMTTEPNTLSELAHGLSAVAARLEPEEAARLCARAADTLSHVEATDLSDQFVLTQGLSAMADRMAPKEAAATLSQAITG
jgi:tRNA A-37 threonylcarbamoyl transferase component Bud32